MTRRLVAVAAMAVALLCSEAFAQNSRTWINPLGGSFQTAGNWSPAEVPTSSSFCALSLPNAYSVLFDADAHAAAIGQHAGDVTLDLRGHHLTLGLSPLTDQTLAVGAGPSATGRMRIFNGMLTARAITIAENGNNVVNRPTGSLRIDGASQVSLSRELWVGKSGAATFTLTEGAAVTTPSAAVLAHYPGSSGWAHVSGPGTTLDVWDLYAGFQGPGTMLVDDSGMLTTRRGVSLGGTLLGVGQVIVRGPSSRWLHARGMANNSFIVGDGGAGVVCLLDSGTLESDQLIENRGTLCGTGMVKGTVLNDGLISPGAAFDDLTRQIALGEVGAFVVDGSLTQTVQGAMRFQLAGAATGEYDVLHAGDASIAGGLSVQALDGFTPSAGDRFELLRCASLFGQFDNVSLPRLDDGLSWRVVYEPIGVSLAVIPAPSTLGVFAATALLGLPRRSRQHPR